MKKIFWLVFFTLSVYPVLAQQDPQLSQNMYNIIMFNPGYAGSKNAICATAVNRQQWVDLEGSPVSSVFTATSPFRLLGADHGVGAYILNDQIGFETNLSFNLSYAYRMDAGAGKIGIGLGAGMINSSLDGEWVVPGGSPAGDPSIPSGNENTFTLDLSAGLFYYTDKLYFGISSTHINEPAVEYNMQAAPFLGRQYYLTAGYSLDLSNRLYRFLPTLTVHSDGVMTQFYFGGMIDYDSRLWGGLSYRHGSAIVGMAGIRIFGDIHVGYSHDFSTTGLRKYSKGTHEFMLRYCFDLGTDSGPRRYKSIRIL
jgi:type IX secretion system PorP/SprF family membrane protein